VNLRKPKNSVIFKKFLGLLVGFAGIFYVISSISLEETIGILENTDLMFLGLSFVVLGFVYFLMGLRWRRILSEKNVSISMWAGFRQIVESDFVNSFAPVRAGDIYRGLIASNSNKNGLDTSIMVLMERVIDVVVISFLFIILLLFSSPNNTIIYPVGAMGLIVSGLIGLKLIYEIEELPISSLNSIYSKFRLAVVKNFRTENKLYLFSLTGVIWILGVLRTFTVFKALDISLGFPLVGLITFVWALVAVVPLTPSGIGTTDATIFFLLSQFEISQSSSAAFVLLNRVVLQGLPIIIGSIFYLERRK